MLLVKQVVGSKFLQQEGVIPQVCSQWGGQGGSHPAYNIPAITALGKRDFVLSFFQIFNYSVYHSTGGKKCTE